MTYGRRTYRLCPRNGMDNELTCFAHYLPNPITLIHFPGSKSL